MVALHEAVVDESDRKRQQHYTTHNTQATKHTSLHSDGVHVSIADSRHGDNNPPTGRRNASVLLVPRFQIQAVLQQLRQRPKYGHGHAYKNKKHDHLTVAAPQRQPQSLEAKEMSRQLDDPKYSHHAQHAQRHAGPLQLRVLARENRHGDGDVIGCDGQKVYDVERTSYKLALVPWYDESHNTLRREPPDADRLNDPGWMHSDGGKNKEGLRG